jgi:predicted GH43/DUF377 family glycosyl hydrolase
MPNQVAQDLLQKIYDTTKTPHKYGIILQPPNADTLYDCPSIFRVNDRWFMLYVANSQKIGYETHLATSDDLLHWEPQGKILSFREDGWDHWQADGGISLVDFDWTGSHSPQKFNDLYWLSYIGGALKGYEPDPLSIGIANTPDPSVAKEWTRLPNNPVLTPHDADARPFEKRTLYKSNIIWDKQKNLGSPFVMFYNGKQEGPVGTERIGIAVSDDMTRWKRFGPGPVIDNGPIGISGDPQIVRIDDPNIGSLWVMFYFGHRWQPKAFDTFACSHDLQYWTRWQGPHLIEPSESWDKTFAHKPWVLNYKGVVYHFYCAVGDKGRAIALATSIDLRK